MSVFTFNLYIFYTCWSVVLIWYLHVCLSDCLSVCLFSHGFSHVRTDLSSISLFTGLTRLFFVNVSCTLSVTEYWYFRGLLSFEEETELSMPDLAKEEAKFVLLVISHLCILCLKELRISPLRRQCSMKIRKPWKVLIEMSDVSSYPLHHSMKSSETLRDY